MSGHHSPVAFHLEQYRKGRVQAAFCGLKDIDPAFLPELANEFRASADTEFRIFLLNIIWHHRQLSMLSLLEEALSDDDSKIWKEALDGLVTLASPESLEVLRRAMMRRFATERETLEFREWLDEAIQQAGDHIKSQITHVRE